MKKKKVSVDFSTCACTQFILFSLFVFVLLGIYRKVKKMYKRIGVDVILRAERRGRKNQCRRLYLIPLRGSASLVEEFFVFLFS